MGELAAAPKTSFRPPHSSSPLLRPPPPGSVAHAFVTPQPRSTPPRHLLSLSSVLDGLPLSPEPERLPACSPPFHSLLTLSERRQTRGLRRSARPRCQRRAAPHAAQARAGRGRGRNVGVLHAAHLLAPLPRRRQGGLPRGQRRAAALAGGAAGHRGPGGGGARLHVCLLSLSPTHVPRRKAKSRQQTPPRRSRSRARRSWPCPCRRAAGLALLPQRLLPTKTSTRAEVRASSDAHSASRLTRLRAQLAATRG
jgi:hypothetical protein